MGSYIASQRVLLLALYRERSLPNHLNLRIISLLSLATPALLPTFPAFWQSTDSPI